MIEQMKQIGLNFYVLMGSITGVAGDFLLNNWHSMALTFVLGFLGALGGALAKLLIDKIKTK